MPFKTILLLGSVCFFISLREHKLDLDAGGVIAVPGWFFDVIIKLTVEVYGEFSYSDNLAHAAAKGYDPTIGRIGIPVCRVDRGGNKVPPLIQIIVDKILEQERIELPRLFKAPDIIDQSSGDPLVLDPNPNGRDPAAPLIRTESGFRGRRKIEYRPHAPGNIFDGCCR